jgi:hypothetical protein
LAAVPKTSSVSTLRAVKVPYEQRGVDLVAL